MISTFKNMMETDTIFSVPFPSNNDFLLMDELFAKFENLPVRTEKDHSYEYSGFLDRYGLDRGVVIKKRRNNTKEESSNIEKILVIGYKQYFISWFYVYPGPISHRHIKSLSTIQLNSFFEKWSSCDLVDDAYY